MIDKFKAKLQFLNTKTFKAVDTSLCILKDYNTLLNRTSDPFITTSIFNKLMATFFKSITPLKVYILKIFKQNIHKFIYSDPLIFKTEILNQLLSIDLDVSECTIKLIMLFEGNFSADEEIYCEVVNLKYKKEFLQDNTNSNKLNNYNNNNNNKNNNININTNNNNNNNKSTNKNNNINDNTNSDINSNKNYVNCNNNSNNNKNTNSNVYSGTMKDALECLLTNNKKPGPKQKYMSALGNLRQMIDFVKWYRNKYTIKLLSKYPALGKYVDNFKVVEKSFLNNAEARSLFKYFRIFEPAWNKNKLNLLKWTDVQESGSLDEKYLFLMKFLEYKKINNSKQILGEIKQSIGLRHDIRIMFEYLYLKLQDGDHRRYEILLSIYGINKSHEFCRINNLITTLKNTIPYRE